MSDSVYFSQFFKKNGVVKTNNHTLERVARVVLGAILTSLTFCGPANYWFLLGLIPLATGLVGWCPP